MKHLQDLQVLVLGLGASGSAMVRWCASHGARVRVWDSRLGDGAAADDALAKLEAGYSTVIGLRGDLLEPAAIESALDGVRLVLKSPGLAPTDARIAPLIAHAKAIALPVQGELDLFAKALVDLKAQRGYAPKVVAVTGTNGKTTTTSMTALLIERAGRRVATAGNIGPTMLDTLAEALALEPAPVEDALDEVGAETGVAVDTKTDTDTNTPAAADDEVIGQAAADAEAPIVEAPSDAIEGADVVAAVPAADADTDAAPADDAVAAAVTGDDEPALQLVPPPPPAPVFEHLPEVWVLELSSFQLDGVRGFEPDAAAVLNLTQDHLDWHGSMQAYAEAKGRIFGQHALMVVNVDDPAVRALAASLQPAPLKPRTKGPKPVPRRELRFGLDMPQRPGDYGLVVEHGMAWLVRAHDADPTLVPRRRGAAAEAPEVHLQRLMPADALRVRGRHNAANAMAALALASAIGCPLAPMLHGLREYNGEPHRVEYVTTVDGVDAYDDSKGTNVGATVAAIDGLGADRAPAKLVVLLGGDGKGQDFSPLVEPIRRHARAVATLGRDAPAVEAALREGLADEFDEGRLPLQRHETLEAATRWSIEQARAGDAVLLSPACASLDMFRNYGHRAQVFIDTLREMLLERGEAA